jgi:hypothetical protein
MTLFYPGGVHLVAAPYDKQSDDAENNVWDNHVSLTNGDAYDIQSTIGKYLETTAMYVA